MVGRQRWLSGGNSSWIGVANSLGPPTPELAKISSEVYYLINIKKNSNKKPVATKPAAREICLNKSLGLP
jgi:hypothetical protein